MEFSAVNTIWVLVGAALVFFMQAGFAMVETGFTRAKNAGNILMTVGAASGLNVILKTLLNPGEQVITFAPYFVEYGSYVRNYDGELVVVSPNTVDFQPNLVEFEEKINEKTKAVIINTPNNPTGVIYSEETLQKIAAILEKKQKEFGTSIVLLSDEPYRELAYDGAVVPYVTKYYRNTVVCYSYSKSLSLPGERIGYIFIPESAKDCRKLYAAVCGAGRALGFVCAPSLMQYTVAECTDVLPDVSAYKKNRDLLFGALTDYGYEAVPPDGAFYLFVKSPEPDAVAFCERAKKYELLLVPSDDFGCEGYVRISYCVTAEQIEKSLPAFKALIKEYK